MLTHSGSETSNAALTHEERLRQYLFVEAHQQGGDPTQILELLEAIVKEKAWETLGINFRELIQAPYPTGVGMKPEDFQTVVFSLSHKDERAANVQDRIKSKDQTPIEKRMSELRKDVGKLLGKDLKVKERGRPTEDKADLISFKPAHGTSREYVLGRLNRDAEDEKREEQEREYLSQLAEQLATRQVSVREAKKRAGYGGQQKTITIPTEPHAAAKRLLRHFDPDELINAIEEARSN